MHEGEWSETTALCRIVVPQPRVKELGAWMGFVGTRPLQSAKLLEARVAHTIELWRQRTHFVPNVLGGWMAPVVPQATGELTHDPDLVARVARRIDRLSTSLNAPLAVRDRALALGPRRRCGEHD